MKFQKKIKIVGIIQSNSRTFLAALKSYLDNEVDIFEDKDMLDHLNEEVPVIINMLASVKKYENECYLLKPVEALFNFMLKLYSNVRKIPNERFVKAENYESDEPPTEFFPGLPLHSEQKSFKVDKKGFKDNETNDDNCNKNYPWLGTHIL